MSKHLTPLEVVECLIAPVADLHRIVGCHPKSPYHWRNASQYRDRGDMPPRINRRLLSYAAVRDLPLEARHLVFGAKRVEIEALLKQMGRPMPTHLLPIAPCKTIAPARDGVAA